MRAVPPAVAFSLFLLPLVAPAQIKGVPNTNPAFTSNAPVYTALERSERITPLTLSATDAEQGAAQLVYTLVSPPVHGTLSATSFTQADVNAGGLRYTVTADFSTSDTLQVSLTDGVSAPSLHTISIQIFGSQDRDRDGLSDGLESAIGTDPDLKDSDGDSVEDGVERAINSNPSDDASPVSANRIDSDGDRIPDAFDAFPASVDGDDDGFLDGYELALKGVNDLSGAPQGYGDANGDSVTNNADALRILESFLGVSAVAFDEKSVDLDRNGSIDNIDAVLLYQWLLGNVSVIPFR